MKKLVMKLSGIELLPDLIMGGFIIIMCGGFLFFQFSQLISSEYNSQLLKFSITITITMICLSWITFYKSAKLWIKWYKKILDYIPMPIIMTRKNANCQQINEAASKVFTLGKGETIDMLNSRQLFDENGNINKKIWIRDGKRYTITGNAICCDNKIEGYIFLLYNLQEMIDICEPQTEANNDIKKLLNQMASTTSYFQDCTNCLTERINRQSDIISRLTNAVELLISGKIDDSFHETMEAILLEMQLNLDYEETHSETIRNFISEVSKINESIANYISDG